MGGGVWGLEIFCGWRGCGRTVPGSWIIWAFAELQLQTPVLPRSTFPCAPRTSPPRSRDRAIALPDLVRGAGLHPSALHQRRSVLRQGGPDEENDPARRLTNPASILQSAEISHGLFGEIQEYPIAVRPPFPFEFRALDPEKFAPRRLVDEDGSALPVDAGHYNLVQRTVGGARLTTPAHRPALLQ